MSDQEEQVYLHPLTGRPENPTHHKRMAHFGLVATGTVFIASVLTLAFPDKTRKLFNIEEPARNSQRTTENKPTSTPVTAQAPANNIYHDLP